LAVDSFSCEDDIAEGTLHMLVHTLNLHTLRYSEKLVSY